MLVSTFCGMRRRQERARERERFRVHPPISVTFCFIYILFLAMSQNKISVPQHYSDSVPPVPFNFISEYCVGGAFCFGLWFSVKECALCASGQTSQVSQVSRGRAPDPMLPIHHDCASLTHFLTLVSSFPQCAIKQVSTCLRQVTCHLLNAFIILCVGYMRDS